MLTLKYIYEIYMNYLMERKQEQSGNCVEKYLLTNILYGFLIEYMTIEEQEQVFSSLYKCGDES